MIGNTSFVIPISGYEDPLTIVVGKRIVRLHLPDDTEDGLLELYRHEAEDFVEALRDALEQMEEE